MASLLSPALIMPLDKVDAVNTKALASRIPSNREDLSVRPISRRRRGQFLLMRNITSLEDDLLPVEAVDDKIGIPYNLSRSGRPAIFTQDPDANALEFTQVD